MPAAFQEPVLSEPSSGVGGKPEGEKLAQQPGHAGALLNGDSPTLPGTLVLPACGNFEGANVIFHCPQWAVPSPQLYTTSAKVMGDARGPVGRGTLGSCSVPTSPISAKQLYPAPLQLSVPQRPIPL